MEKNLTEFIPRTQTINRDRKYFIYGDRFLKYDLNKDRGEKEADIQSLLSHPSIPKIYSHYNEGRYHVIEMELVPGETLENLTLSKYQKNTVIEEIFILFRYLFDRGVVHGDINVSNILLVQDSIYLIDWEMARISPGNLTDLYGPPWGILDLIKRI